MSRRVVPRRLGAPLPVPETGAAPAGNSLQNGGSFPHLQRDDLDEEDAVAYEKPLSELEKPDWISEEAWQATLAKVESMDRIRSDAKAHVETYLATNGREGYQQELAPLPCLLITTIGHKSGKQVITALNFVLRGEKYIVVGSLAGKGDDPAWAKNLKKTPQAWVQVKDKKWEAHVQLLTPEERAEIWPELVRVMPLWEVFQQRTDRLFPVFVLTPK